MSIFSIVGKGIVKEIETIKGKRVVVLPDSFDGNVTHVRVYKLRKIV